MSFGIEPEDWVEAVLNGFVLIHESRGALSGCANGESWTLDEQNPEQCSALVFESTDEVCDVVMSGKLADDDLSHYRVQSVTATHCRDHFPVYAYMDELIAAGLGGVLPAARPGEISR